MSATRKRHRASFKAKVALETAEQTRAAAELAKAFQVHHIVPAPPIIGKPAHAAGFSFRSRTGSR